MEQTPRVPNEENAGSVLFAGKTAQVERMFDTIAPRYDFLNRMLSCGQDLRWRRALLSALPKPPTGAGTVYDIACGTGDVLLGVLKKRADYVKLTGVDVSSGMLRCAHGRYRDVKNVLAAKGRQPEVSFVRASAEELPFSENTADAVTIAFGLRNVDNRERALREFSRVLKPGGVLCVLEFFPAENGLMSSFFLFYFRRVLPFIGGLFSDRAAYRYLPESVSTMPSGHAFAAQLGDAGFQHCTEKTWLSGAVRLFCALKAKSSLDV